MNQSTMRDKIYYGKTLQTRRIKKPNNYLSMIDRFADNGLQHISRFPDKIYHLGNREYRSNTILLETSQVLITLITSQNTWHAKGSECKGSSKLLRASHNA